MALFDSLLNETAEKFGVGEKASALLTALLGYIVNKGSLGDFLQMFHDVGLGEIADSWVSRGASAPLSDKQMTDALGAETIQNLAEKAGVSVATATPVLSYLIPAVVDKLTPNGFVPEKNSLFSALAGYLPAGSSAAAATRTNASVPNAFNNRVDTNGGSALRWILPLILLAILGFTGYQFCSKPNQSVQVVNLNAKNANANVAATTTMAKIDPRLSVKAENGKYFVSGAVSSEAEKNQIVEIMKKELGEANVDFSGLKVEPNARRADWLAKFVELAPSLKNWTGGALTFEGENRLSVVGSIPQNVIDKIKSLFGGWQLPAIFLGAGAEAQKAANEQAAAALKSAATPQQVVDALNISIINFATGKSEIPADAQKILQDAAAVLKNAPSGTMIEISGHTDNQGSTASNQKLSEARANAVKNELIKLGVKPEMLTAKGYGDTKPKADNKTEVGRFQNRRIEYALNATNNESATDGAK
jgi:OOP family OmpA-OmpF porin